jgi:hypothetical protein
VCVLGPGLCVHGPCLCVHGTCTHVRAILSVRSGVAPSPLPLHHLLLQCPSLPPPVRTVDLFIIAGLVVALYYWWFFVHFSYLPLSGQYGDAFMPIEFQRTLINSTYYDVSVCCILPIVNAHRELGWGLGVPVPLVSARAYDAWVRVCAWVLWAARCEEGQLLVDRQRAEPGNVLRQRPNRLPARVADQALPVDAQHTRRVGCVNRSREAQSYTPLPTHTHARLQKMHGHTVSTTSLRPSAYQNSAPVVCIPCWWRRPTNQWLT